MEIDIMNYLVIIGDIVNSKKIKERNIFQKKFNHVLQNVQEAYNEVIRSPLTLTLGDEFQVVVKNASRLLDLTTAIEIQMEDTNLRFGIGAGQIETDINQEKSIGMDGPAFHFAREAIDLARKRGQQYQFISADPVLNTDLGLLLEWINTTTSRWKYKRKKILYYQRQNMGQKQIAKFLGLTQPAISQNLNDPYFKLVNESYKIIETKINANLELSHDVE